ncbi:uncharacterized protein LOC127060431 [Serinus canaria]|uniref:uncharacterized protein LOC127060431 n=1 Tax=Serinus canaria TaxID=9135 RepID=UPI0021CC7F72|nr:uncharacterized protein LOC127060431 [Serinus canaria]
MSPAGTGQPPHCQNPESGTAGLGWWGYSFLRGCLVSWSWAVGSLLPQELLGVLELGSGVTPSSGGAGVVSWSWAVGSLLPQGLLGVLELGSGVIPSSGTAGCPGAGQWGHSFLTSWKSWSSFWAGPGNPRRSQEQIQECGGKQGRGDFCSMSLRSVFPPVSALSKAQCPRLCLPPLCQCLSSPAGNSSPTSSRRDLSSLALTAPSLPGLAVLAGQPQAGASFLVLNPSLSSCHGALGKHWSFPLELGLIPALEPPCCLLFASLSHQLTVEPTGFTLQKGSSQTPESQPNLSSLWSIWNSEFGPFLREGWELWDLSLHFLGWCLKRCC